MRPNEILAEPRTADGTRLTLVRQSGALQVQVNGVILMSSHVHGSEDIMAELACKDLKDRADVRVLVGGLGMGFTLRATLDALGPQAHVVVSELYPDLVAWNRGVLAPLADHPLADPRVQLVEGDVAALLRASRAAFDVILLDVDNGPEAFTTPSNGWLYGPAGLTAIRDALKPGGLVVVWSGFSAPRFVGQLARAGLAAEAVPVRERGHVAKGARHMLYVGRRQATRAGPPRAGSKRT